MRILLANEPRSHREVFAGALRALRPHLEVITVRPNALEGEAPRLRPDAVVCSRVTGRSRDPDPGLDVLLQFVDRGEEQSRNARQTPDTHREPGGGR